MFVLAKEQFYKVKSLFAPYRHQLLTRSVMEGHSVGEIYVDNRISPKCAVMRGIHFEVYLAGDPGCTTKEKEFSDWFSEQIFAPVKEKGFPYLNVYYVSEAWKQRISRFFAQEGYQTEQVKKRFYTLDLNAASRSCSKFDLVSTSLPGGASIQPITSELVNDTEKTNLDQMLLWIELSWPSVEHFLQHGMGYAVVEDNAIASWCLTLFAADADWELGLMTLDAYRKKGYAKALALACVNYSLANGKQPLWNCDDTNLPSIHVAESVGFQLERSYEVFQVFVK